MIAAIAGQQWRRQSRGLLFWLVAASSQLLIAWLVFAQLERFTAIAPQLRAAGSGLDAHGLLVTPTLNSVAMLLMVAVPLLAMGGLADDRRSGRLAFLLTLPTGTAQLALGRILGLWLATLPLLATLLATVALLGLGIRMDWAVFAVAAAGLLLFALWLSCLCVMLSALFDHPAAALTATLAVLLVLWLLDSFGDTQAAWYPLALLPHLKPWLEGLLRSGDLLYFAATGGAAGLYAVFTLSRLRGEV
jgi:ABC-2 type transport system permease protein